MMFELAKGFSLLLALIRLSFTFAYYGWFSQDSFAERTFFYPFTSVYEQSLGGFTFADIDPNDVSEELKIVCLVFFTLFVVIVILNLLITVLSELNADAKERSKAEWAFMQAQMLLLDTARREVKGGGSWSACTGRGPAGASRSSHGGENLGGDIELTAVVDVMNPAFGGGEKKIPDDGDGK